MSILNTLLGMKKETTSEKALRKSKEALALFGELASEITTDACNIAKNSTEAVSRKAKQASRKRVRFNIEFYNK